MGAHSRCILISIDGLRPDGLEQAATPHIDQLLAGGASHGVMRTVMPSVTLPCHMSMFHSVPPARHGITTNTFSPQVRPIPGIFEVVHDAGFLTGSFRNWDELRDLGQPGAMSHSFYCDYRNVGMDCDAQVAAAAKWVTGGDRFAFVYFGYTDVVGHAHGWMSDVYLDAIAHADQCVGQLLTNLPAESCVLIVSDHGGHDRTHGTDMDEDMHVPIIIASPEPCSMDRDLSILDVAPTVVTALGLEVPREWEGQSILG